VNQSTPGESDKTSKYDQEGEGSKDFKLRIKKEEGWLDGGLAVVPGVNNISGTIYDAQKNEVEGFQFPIMIDAEQRTLPRDYVITQEPYCYDTGESGFSAHSNCYDTGMAKVATCPGSFTGKVVKTWREY
jgi:hypothetical protein